MTKKKQNRLIPAFIIAFFFHSKIQSQTLLFSSEPDASERKWNAYLKGFIQADVMLDFQEIQFKEGFVSPSITVPQQDLMGSHFSLKQSQIGLGLKQSDRAGDSDLSAYIEIDFLGPNGTTSPRFRQGYIQWKKFLIGQTWSNFSDVDIFPNIFDFAGPNGMMLSRTFQIRYSEKLSEKENLSLSMEDPDAISVSIPDIQTGWKKRNFMPIVTASYRYGNVKNYIKIGGILSPINYKKNDKTNTRMGFGGVFSSRKSIGNANNLRFQTSYGKGYSSGSQILRGEGYDAVLNSESENPETLSLFNILGIYEHWWSPKWSSVVYYSFSEIGNNPMISQTKIKRFQNAAVNLIYQPYKNLRLGAEANYGKIKKFGNGDAEAFRVQLSTSLSF
ncbi:DcaP family trimeric outer membrane transporter [Chryseobacterium sp. JM1]|uniref:DcaP family trimeric outer membrane transporter n=1 Tax=Chryseobacterium sp. JM1 TaxID=1233950 RepID=UPI0004E77164|nr:DcaP family trimeric outer membrane transporter [Chryseobacterium sp. JM1]KFF21605.1 hypothetical protein IW22_06530 [Chryseobacterium sp. JM1]